MLKEAPPIGTWVTALRPFNGVPRFTEGVVDQHWEGGCTIAWNRVEAPLPDGYREHDGTPSWISGILRDGFTLDELRFLMISRGPDGMPLPEAEPGAILARSKLLKPFKQRNKHGRKK